MNATTLFAAGFERYTPPANLRDLVTGFERRTFGYVLRVHRWHSNGEFDAALEWPDGCPIANGASMQLLCFPVTNWEASNLVNWADDVWHRLSQ